MKGRLVEIISVDRDRNCVYVAHHSAPPNEEEASNAEWQLDAIEKYLGFTLPDGYMNVIVKFYWYPDYSPFLSGDYPPRKQE